MTCRLLESCGRGYTGCENTITEVPTASLKASAGNPMNVLRARLSKAGVPRSFLNQVVLPGWWNDSLAVTPGGFREAAGYVCAHLGFSLGSLLDPSQELAFGERGAVKFKRPSGVSDSDVCLATHLALGVARAAATAYLERPPALAVPAPEEWRGRLMADSGARWVGLRDVLIATWRLGIPVIQVRHVPVGGKKPDALATLVGDRPVIMVMNRRKSPSWLSFIIAHELGHLHHRHLRPGQTLVDEKVDQQSGEKDEREANDFALRLLTGQSDLGLSSTRRLDAKALAEAAEAFGRKYCIAPGVAALNYGFTTGEWPVAIGAVTRLEADRDAAAEMLKAQEENLDLEALSEEARDWILRATRPSG